MNTHKLRHQIWILLAFGAYWVRAPSASALQEARWDISPAPVVSIGVEDGDDRYILEEVTGIVRTADGRILVADGQRQTVRAYDASGRHLADWGREGAGPGEYRYLRRLYAYRGDSLAAFDMRARRITVLSSSGTVGRIVSQQVGMIMRSGYIPAQSCCDMAGALADGSFLIEMPEMIQTNASGTFTSEVTLVRLSSDGARVDTIAVVPGSEYRGDRTVRNGFRAAILGPRFHVAVTDRALVHGNGSAPSFSLIMSDGTRRNGIPLSASRSRVTPAMRQAEVAERRRRFEQGPSEGTLEQYLSVPITDYLPAFDRIIPDGPEQVWLRQPRIPGDTSSTAEYVVMNVNGRTVARVRIDADLFVMQVSNDMVLGVVWSELGVPVVKGYSLRRSS